MNVQKFQLTDEYIELIKLLKLLGLVESGADAKISVEDGLVNCNGKTEFRKRKKLRSGEFIIFKDNRINIV